MNTKPFVSVVMSVYNGELFLKEAIDSILSQTYKKFEFIIIDDASTCLYTHLTLPTNREV